MTHITIEKEKLEQVLEALEIDLVFLRNVKPFSGQEDLASGCVSMTDETITSLRQALIATEKQALSDPVSGVVMREGNPTLLRDKDIKTTDERLYTTPQQRTWVGLTNEDKQELAKHHPYGSWEELCSTIEAKLKAKNNLLDRDGL